MRVGKVARAGFSEDQIKWGRRVFGACVSRTSLESIARNPVVDSASLCVVGLLTSDEGHMTTAARYRGYEYGHSPSYM